MTMINKISQIPEIPDEKLKIIKTRYGFIFAGNGPTPPAPAGPAGPKGLAGPTGPTGTKGMVLPACWPCLGCPACKPCVFPKCDCQRIEPCDNITRQITINSERDDA